MKRLFNWFNLAGILFLAAGALLYARDAAFRASSEQATATVVGFNEYSDEDGNPYTCPVLEFTTAAGQVVSFVSNICGTTRLGDTREVYYDPGDPQHATVQGFFSQNIAELILGAIGVGFLVLGLRRPGAE